MLLYSHAMYHLLSKLVAQVGGTFVVAAVVSAMVELVIRILYSESSVYSLRMKHDKLKMGEFSAMLYS
jgi:hypothetical protein